ncbi:50S ribosomal protein L16 [Candidatus Pacearchaeota archaeon CG10_big_fil_rev_8_21_14_0_10_34_76]|nr:MAG: 50S ribosomal protein L16 [Candidatus Pacearchaeota archaeon CG10_big_fil_rev_8_21_14_0_10_34_76]
MASLRKALAYSKKHARPYTRVSKNKSKSYIKQVPHNKIVKYNLGNVDAYNQGKLKHVARFIAEERAQIRDNSLEACRLLMNKALEKNVPKQFYLQIKVYPHHILRNNKTAAGAGADRLSSGMKHSFGVIEGRAAMVNAGKELFVVYCENEKVVRFARRVLNMVKSKVPCKGRVVVELAE